MSNTPVSNRLEGDRDEEPDPSLLKIEINADPNLSCSFSEAQLRRAIHLAATLCGLDRGEIGLRVSDDPTIREINAKHLGHDYPTDVISFGYVLQPPRVEGELVVSIDTARTRSLELGWSVDNELCLYVVHGTLHLAGMDDLNDDDRAAMRDAEKSVMIQLGIKDISRFGPDSEVLAEGVPSVMERNA